MYITERIAQQSGKENEGKKEWTIILHYFPSTDLKFYINKEVKTIVMEHFNGTLFHKSGPANKQHTN